MLSSEKYTHPTPMGKGYLNLITLLAKLHGQMGPSLALLPQLN